MVRSCESIEASRGPATNENKDSSATELASLRASISNPCWDGPLIDCQLSSEPYNTGLVSGMPSAGLTMHSVPNIFEVQYAIYFPVRD